MKNEETYTLEIARLKRANEVLKEKSAEEINELICRNSLLNQNLKNTSDEVANWKAQFKKVKASLEQVQEENEIIHNALVEIQDENVNLEITIKTLTKMVK